MKNMRLINLYYRLKPYLPRRLQLLARRGVATAKRAAHAGIWPIDAGACNKPEGWSGWPGGKQFALILTHDVDTRRGHDRCRHLIALEKEMGFRSSFNFVAGEYSVSSELRSDLAAHGFEVGIHGFVHNAQLYESRDEFMRQAVLINRTLNDWGAVGFRSPCMYHNLEWLRELEILYDASTFDTDPFEPQPDGAGTIFPFLVERENGAKAYVELPYTLPQDFTLFVLFREKGIDTWKRKLDWVARHGGMVLLNTHPDYMDFGPGKPGYEEYTAEHYRNLLGYIRERYEGCYWHALPHQIAKFWMRRDVTKARVGRLAASDGISLVPALESP